MAAVDAIEVFLRKVCPPPTPASKRSAPKSPRPAEQLEAPSDHPGAPLYAQPMWHLKRYVSTLTRRFRFRCLTGGRPCWTTSHGRRQRLTVYLDLHAHASARGCFIYGNHLPSLEDQVGGLVADVGSVSVVAVG